MTSLSNLPPDQASALRLLAGGRTYAAVADLLGISTAAVEQTALSGADLLAGNAAEALTESERLRVLTAALGLSEDDPLMKGSPAAAEYAQRIQAHLGVPEVHDSSAPKQTPLEKSPPADTQRFPAVAKEAPTGKVPSPSAIRQGPSLDPSTPSDRSRGIALLAGLGAVVVLALVIIWQPWSGNDSEQSAQSSSTTSSTQQASGSGSTGANGWTVKSKYELKPVAGGSGKALAGIETKGNSAALLIAGNGVQAGSTVGIWLTGPGGPGLVGFQKVNGKGQFSAIGPVPKNVSTATQIIVSQEKTTPGGKVPSQPGPTLLSSAFSFQ